MDMQFVLGDRAASHPAPAAADDNGCRADQVFQGRACLLRALVQLDAERKAFK